MTDTSTTPLPSLTHEEISDRARRLWRDSGAPEGRDLEFWLQAESSLRFERAQVRPEPATAAPPPEATAPGNRRAGERSAGSSTRTASRRTKAPSS